MSGARIRIALNLYVFSTLGVFLATAPWSPVWDASTAFAAGSQAAGVLRSGWVRGLVSGLGALNLLAAAGELRALWQSFGGDLPGDGERS